MRHSRTTATIPVPAPQMGTRGLFRKIGIYGRMIRFSHTVFALPFALSALVLAQRQAPLTAWTAGWVLVAMVAARSAAMGFNRIVDAALDAANPRTAGREIPAGQISRGSAWVFVIASSALFVLAAAMLGRLCLRLSVPVLLLLLAYSYTKRLTWAAHLYLGFAISLAPLGTWIALTGTVTPAIFALCAALMAYIAGFDILYACQDLEFDRRAGLHSVPSRFGPAAAFRLAALLHLLSWGCFALTGKVFDMGAAYFTALSVIGGLMVAEHRLVRPDDLSRINLAFFHMNSLISVTLLLGVLADEGVRRWV